jgi:DNA-directed RNA polymerase subunit N (RpoN/RPB10)
MGDYEELLPVRCITCGKVMREKYLEEMEKVGQPLDMEDVRRIKELEPSMSLADIRKIKYTKEFLFDKIGINKPCCRSTIAFPPKIAVPRNIGPVTGYDLDEVAQTLDDVSQFMEEEEGEEEGEGEGEKEERRKKKKKQQDMSKKIKMFFEQMKTDVPLKKVVRISKMKLGQEKSNQPKHPGVASVKRGGKVYTYETYDIDAPPPEKFSPTEKERGRGKGREKEKEQEKEQEDKQSKLRKRLMAKKEQKGKQQEKEQEKEQERESESEDEDKPSKLKKRLMDLQSGEKPKTSSLLYYKSV